MSFDVAMPHLGELGTHRKFTKYCFNPEMTSGLNKVKGDSARHYFNYTSLYCTVSRAGSTGSSLLHFTAICLV